MAGLRCGEVSSIAWPVIANEADAFVAVDDEQCVTAMRALAHPGEDAFVVRTGPAGACGLAALLAILTDGTLRPLREASSLGSESRVLVFNTEGMTDQQQYERLLGNERELLDGRTTVTDGPP
jgi:diaminopropionate ammonia-lyase